MGSFLLGGAERRLDPAGAGGDPTGDTEGTTIGTGTEGARAAAAPPPADGAVDDGPGTDPTTSDREEPAAAPPVAGSSQPADGVTAAAAQRLAATPEGVEIQAAADGIERPDRKHSDEIGAAPKHAPGPSELALQLDPGSERAPSGRESPRVEVAPPSPMSDPPSERTDGALQHARARVVLGEGASRVALEIAATRHTVRIEAHAASESVARALRESSGELRSALQQHGLDLASLSAGSGGGEAKSRPAPPEPRAQGGKAVSAAPATDHPSERPIGADRVRIIV